MKYILEYILYIYLKLFWNIVFVEISRVEFWHELIIYKSDKEVSNTKFHKVFVNISFAKPINELNALNFIECKFELLCYI